MGTAESRAMTVGWLEHPKMAEDGLRNKLDMVRRLMIAGRESAAVRECKCAQSSSASQLLVPPSRLVLEFLLPQSLFTSSRPS